MTIDVHLMDNGTDLSPGLAESLYPKLTGLEQIKAAAIADPLQRNRYVLSHAALHALASAGKDGHPPTQFRISPAGRPEFTPGPHVSLSRAGGLVAIALCQTAPIGIDIALNLARDWVASAQTHPGIAGRLRRTGTTDRNVNFLRAWTELEAIAKLRQIPLDRLLSTWRGWESVLRTYVNPHLVLTIASAEQLEVSIFSTCWDAAGELICTGLHARDHSGTALAGLRELI